MSTSKTITNTAEFEAKFQALLGHDRIVIRPYGHHLLIQLVVEKKPETIARVTKIKPNLYQASYRTHSGRWEQLPREGNLSDICELAVDLL
ncbi:MAG: hypothetical protein LLG04_05325 [Parachlamydia sp.]|nr:hypothetical protein [Parachlamydia sp.]